jgi:hypothetical protein
MAVRKTSLKVIGEGIEGAFLIAGNILMPFLRPWRLRWGATDEEVKMALPGDDATPNPRIGWTHAITVQAPVEKVWPWLVQIGQRKGGFYSYDFLENLAGCQIYSADRILPDCQSLQVGDTVGLHPVAKMPVTFLEPGRGYLLSGDISTMGQPDNAPAKEPIMIGWLFYSYPLDEKSCRVISRWRVEYTPSFKNDLSFGKYIIEPLGFVMDRKMLLGIKQRAESVLN